MFRTYSELIRIPSFEERFEYLSIGARVGERTFGSRRFFNQEFYRSQQWRSLRSYLIVRDQACDIAHPDWPIPDRIVIHHLNPIREENFDIANPALTDPENLVCVSYRTHNAIHYGDAGQLPKPIAERRPNDTCPWK